jgi:hypothetical protein
VSALLALLGVVVGGGAYIAGILLWSRYDDRRFRRRFYGE